MRLILLWPNNKIPTIDTWTEYCPANAAYVDDEFIPKLKEVITHQYLNSGSRARLLLVLVESLFYSMPFIHSKDGDEYTLRSLVRLKPISIRDYNITIVSNLEDYKSEIKKYGENVIECGDVIRKERKSTDETVELFYYQREIIDVIENL